MVFNAGFGLFLFFFYKYLFFIFVQIKYGMDSFGLGGIILIGGILFILIFYVARFLINIDNFKTFTEQITGRQAKINIFDTLGKNKIIDAAKIQKI